MKVPSVLFTGSGGTEVICLGETEIRPPGVGEVTVEIAAAGLNRADILQRKGMYPAPAGAPRDVPGLEFSGTVIERGAASTMWPVGAQVMAIVAGGAMAKRITLHERELMPVPRGVELTDAAAIPEAFLTVWDAFSQALLVAGETALIHAAASGIGTAALQLCRAMGVRALATTRSANKLALITKHGIVDGDGIVVADNQFSAAVLERSLTGVNMILDCIGASYFEENIRSLALRGRLVLLGTMGGASGPAPIGMLLGKRATVIGTVMRARSLEEKCALAQAATARLIPMFERGLLVPVIDAKTSMAQCANAHKIMEDNKTVGKLVLVW
jgi:NADPH:quinone reductase